MAREYLRAAREERIRQATLASAIRLVFACSSAPGARRNYPIRATWSRITMSYFGGALVTIGERGDAGRRSHCHCLVDTGLSVVYEAAS